MGLSRLHLLALSAVLSLLLGSCSGLGSQDGTVGGGFSGDVSSDESAVQFIISGEFSGQNVPSELRYTLTTSEGHNVLGHFHANVSLNALSQGVYATDVISVNARQYLLNEFIVLNSLNAPIFVAPRQGSVKAAEVSYPLSLPLLHDADEEGYVDIVDTVSSMNIETLAFAGGDPDDFGYSSTELSSSGTLSFRLTLDSMGVDTADIIVFGGQSEVLNQSISEGEYSFQVPSHDSYQVLVYKGVEPLHTQHYSYEELAAKFETPINLDAVELTQVVSLALSDSHAMAVKNSGHVWVSGANNVGSFGNNEMPSTQSWVLAPIQDIDGVALSPDASYFVDKSGTLWVSGRNDMGQFGLGHTNMVLNVESVNRSVFSDASIRHVELDGTAGNSAFVATEDGTLYATGLNQYGELGLGHSNPVTTWTYVTSNVSMVSLSQHHAVLRNNDGEVFFAGSNANGQAGQGTVGGQFTDWVLVSRNMDQVAASEGSILMIRNSDSTLWGAGQNSATKPYLGVSSLDDNQSNLVQLVSSQNVSNVFADGENMFYLDSAGDLFGAGVNANAVNPSGAMGLGHNNIVQDWVEVRSGVAVLSLGVDQHVLASPMMEIFATGVNDTGQFGQGDATARSTWDLITVP